MASLSAQSTHTPFLKGKTRFSPYLATPLFLAISAICNAQSTQEPQRVEPITLTSRAAPVLDIEQADVGSFGTALSKTPQSITVLGADLLSATGVQTLSSLLRLDASLSDNYNAVGYIESLSIRGFNLDQIANFRRNGLATSNYAPIALENKERIEVLKGVAGLQAGVSAPGGLVNYVTKQPLRERFVIASVSGDHHGGMKAQVDANTQWGALGVRVNAASERLDNAADHASGSRHVVSAAFALPISANTSLAAELEYHKKSQPSVPGLGLLDANNDGVAETLPVVLTRLNLNNQPWSLPVETTTTQASIKLVHQFNDRWRVTLGAASFISKMNDRIAFPDGCGNANFYVYPGLCGNGDIDIYDFRSDNEKRRVTSWSIALDGQLNVAGTTHRPRVALSGYSARLDTPAMSAYNYAGTVNIFAPSMIGENSVLESVNTERQERSADAALSVMSEWTNQLQSFIGLRSTNYHAASARTNGKRATSYEQTVHTPWAGWVFNVSPTLITYASWGQGVELEVVPNRPQNYTNFGAALPALKSSQTEIGVKWQIQPRLLATVAVFSIDKPYADDKQITDTLQERVANGKNARHRGIELSATGRVSDALSVQASASYLDARFTRAIDPALVNQRVTNVPRLTTSIFADYKLAAVRGLSLNALVWTQHGKTVTSNGSVTLPAAWQLDLGASYSTQLVGKTFTVRMNVENATDREFWREAPTTSWGGTYLFPAQPRTLKLSANFEF